ncbi:MAG: DUF2089 family protein [Rikenellaceae bacterium]|nr:DUF2089 family protein [Rikenellaceae bacterium]
MTNERKIPTCCPSCGNELHVQSLHCKECDTTITGDYPLPTLLRLSADEMAFVLAFLRCSGSLKEMATQMKLSYPTVRNLLDNLIDKLNTLQNNE